MKSTSHSNLLPWLSPKFMCLSSFLFRQKVQRSVSPWLLPDHRIRKLLLMHSRNLLDCLCPAVLSLKWIIRWSKFCRRTRACKHNSSCRSLKVPYQTDNTMPPVLLHMLILIHKLSAKLCVSEQQNHIKDIFTVPVLPKKPVSIHGSILLSELPYWISPVSMRL